MKNLLILKKTFENVLPEFFNDVLIFLHVKMTEDFKILTNLSYLFLNESFS